MQAEPVTSPSTFEAIRRRRAEMRESMTALEKALAAPASGRVEGWAERVHVALVELSADLRLHRQVTEARGGLHESLVSTAPRLAGPVARLARDHTRLTDAVEELTELAELADADDYVTEVRALGIALLSDLARHRQRGSDLVWEAYAVDIGGEM